MTSQSCFPRGSGLVGQTIDAGRLELVKVLGEGAYGVVYLAVEQLCAAGSSSKASPREFAVKVLPKADSDSPVGQCQSREIVMHKIASDHPGILTLHDVLEDDRFIFLVLDYCPGGDLYNMVVEREVFCQNDALIKSVFVQLLDAVQSIHDKGIYHRDLKPDNIFVSEDSSKVCLGDFGLATDLAVSTNFECGSSFYMSPGMSTPSLLASSMFTHCSECIGEEHRFAAYSLEGSDVWSLGVILVNMVVGRNPWRKAVTHDQHFHQFMSDPDDFIKRLLPMSGPASELIKRVFTFSPTTRISLEEFREAFLAIDTFFHSQEEADSAVRDKRVADSHASPNNPISAQRTSPATPQLPPGVTEDASCMHSYPDEEYIFSSPDPEAAYEAMSSALSTPSTVFSPTSTLCGEDDLDVFSTACESKLAAKAMADEIAACPMKGTKYQRAGAIRLLQRLVL